MKRQHFEKKFEKDFEQRFEHLIHEKEALLKNRIIDEGEWIKARIKRKSQAMKRARFTHEESSTTRHAKRKERRLNAHNQKKPQPLLLRLILSPFYLLYYVLFAVYKTVAFIGLIAKYIILSPFLLISFIISKITMYIRMSLSFKITFIFSLVFILFSFVYHLLIGALATHFTISNYINYTEGLFISAVVSTLFGLFIMISIGVKVAKKVLAPIEQMTEDIKEISSNSLDKRLNVSTAKDELKDLAIAFNGMLDELHEMYDKQSMFVSDASHELRTPIAVIQGYSSMLDRWGKNDEAVLSESLSAIKTEAENMKALVEKLLFLARADKNRIVLDKEFFDIAALMNDILRETEMIAPNHTIRGELHFDGQLFGDSNSIKQALRVFIDNSIKYTPENGNILIALNKAENHVIISIEDTGIGIPKDDVPHIFDRFYRADKSRTKETGGNGLGLSIAKWILDQHHCQVFVDSTVDVGTKITILFKYL